MRLKPLLILLALAGALAGCQGILGTGGKITGFTVPPGCKGSFTFTWPMPQGSIMGSCDETAEKPAAGARAFAAVPTAPQGAHVTIDRN